MQTHDAFCRRCGKPFRAHRAHHHASTHNLEREPRERLFCELSYTGFLFWLPLVFCPDEPHAKTCANQGLWALIIATICCTVIRFAGAINTFFTGSLIGLLYGSIYALLFMVFLSFMLLLMWKCLKNAYQIHKGEAPESILFFDSMAIIH